MKKILLTLTALFVVTGVFAETAQPAFRLLDGYLEKRVRDAEYGRKNGSWILIGTGLLAGAAGTTLFLVGDSLAASAGVAPMPRDAKFGTSLGLWIGGGVLTTIGVALNLFPPTSDERANYQAIYRESDPATQEALAAARLKSMSQDAKDQRTVNGFVNLGLVGVSTAFRIATAVDQGKPWSSNMFGVWSWESGTVLSGFAALFVRSQEEALYQQYLDVTKSKD